MSKSSAIPVLLIASCLAWPGAALAQRENPHPVGSAARIRHNMAHPVQALSRSVRGVKRWGTARRRDHRAHKELRQARKALFSASPTLRTAWNKAHQHTVNMSAPLSEKVGGYLMKTAAGTALGVMGVGGFEIMSSDWTGTAPPQFPLAVPAVTTAAAAAMMAKGWANERRTARAAADGYLLATAGPSHRQITKGVSQHARRIAAAAMQKEAKANGTTVTGMQARNVRERSAFWEQAPRLP